jgi:hypothetical protein
VVTDGAFFPDGRHVVVRTYTTMAVHDARSWRSEVRAKLPAQHQGEGLAMLSTGREVLISSEGANSDVLSVPLSGAMLEAAAQSEPTGGSAPAPTTEPPVPPSGEADGGPGTGMVVGVTAAGLAMAGAVAAALLWRRRRGQSRSTT